MKFFKVLIVDDDLPILQSLRNFAWEQYGCQLVGEAQNGVEAFDQCRNLSPDIIITDIVMPLMDGIELTKSIKKWNPSIQIIIITSYRDFEYAKEALHLGAKEYLLKGVYTDEELIMALNRAKEEFDKETIRIKYKNESDIIRKNETLLNILVHKDSTENENVEVFLKLPARFVMLYLVWNIAPGLLSEKKVGELLFSYDALHIHEIIIISSQEIHLLYKDIDVEHIIKDVRKLMDKIEDTFNWCGLKCFASIGSIVCSLEQYKIAVRKNHNTLRKKFYYTESEIFISDQVKFRALSKEEKQKLNHLHKTPTSTEELENYLKNEFIVYMMINNIDPEDVKLLLFSWVSDILKENTFGSSYPFIEENGHLLCIHQLINKYITLYRHIHQSTVPEERYEISKALQIINQKLNCNLTADSIAEEIGLSPNYFGYIFKHYMGQNFKEYLTQIRMEKALFLIKNTNLKVYEVAEQVGIPNYRYFISVFQKYYNKSPSDVKGGK